MRNLLGAGNDADLVNGPNLGAQAAVDAEELAVYDCRENQKVENVAACLPDGRVTVLLLALLVEPVNLRDLPGLVVAADENDPVGVSKVVVSDEGV